MAWLDALPRLVEECASEWGLELGPPFEDLHISYVAPATLPDGTRAVLKITFPEAEGEHEADALAHWNGDGAVRLLAHDRERRALVLERCEPGTKLWHVEEAEANAVVAALLRRLWRRPQPGHEFRLLAHEVEEWAAYIPARWHALGRPFEQELVDRALTALRSLPPSQGELVVVHQDLHGGNVLRAEREPWLVIDPKPLVGEREFDVASLLRDRRDELVRDPAPERRMKRRLDQVADELDLDRERAREWAIAHALAWGVSERGADAQMVSCARWLAAA